MISRTAPHPFLGPSCRLPDWKRLLIVGTLLFASAAALPAQAAENDAQKLMETVGPAVVTIKTSGGKMGSGFMLDQETVVTNFHVISGAEKAEVVLSDKSHFKVTGFLTAQPEFDIAILAVKLPAEMAAQAPKIAKDLPKAGEKVFALGAPLSLSGSISDGIVSAVRRGDEIEAARQLGYSDKSIWVQMTAPISPGNSGGPIVNSAGEVLGLSTFFDKRGQNVNFAISGTHILAFREASLFLGKQEKKLSELPPMKGLEVSGAGGGNAAATLDFWKQWSRLRTKARAGSKAHPKVRASQIAQQTKISHALLGFAEEVTNLKTHDVDPGLLQIVSRDAAIHRRLGEACGRLADASRNSRGMAMANSAREIELLNRQLAESDNALTQFRFELSQGYGCEFPSYLQKSESKKSDDRAEAPGPVPEFMHPRRGVVH